MAEIQGMDGGGELTSVYAGHRRKTQRQSLDHIAQYGDVFTIRLGPTNLGFVLGTATSANAILEKQAGISADRPRQTMANTYLSGGMRTLLMSHNDKWRELEFPQCGSACSLMLTNDLTTRYQS